MRRYMLEGSIDLATVGHYRQELEEIHDDLVVDCFHLVFIDSSGIKLLQEIRESLRIEGFTYSLENPTPTLAKILSILNISWA